MIGLEAHGFRVLAHRLVPPNDGGIGYGQAVAASRF
jgi:hydrogenase maturation protein HypF